MNDIKISPLIAEDRDCVFEFLQDEEVMRFLGPRRPLTDKEATDWFDLELNTPTRPAFRCAVTNDLIGFCGIKIIDGVPDFAYFLLKKYWGRGYAVKLCRMTVLLLSPKTDFSKVCMFIAENNIASQRVAEKLGWKRVSDSSNQHEKGHLYQINSCALE